MKHVRIIIAIMIFSALASGQETKNENGNVLEDVVVQESYEAIFEEEKPPLALNVDFSDVVSIKERVSWSSLDKDQAQNQHETSLELHFSRPELARIRPAPVQVFHVNLQNIARWQLDIIASDGSLFRRLSGEGNPPETLSWDGKSDQDEPLIPGHSYSYNMIAVDKAGNKGTFPGQSFQVPAFYLQQGESLLIGLAGSTLFSADGLRLNFVAEEFAREIANLIRYFSKKNHVTVAGGDANIDKFLQLIAGDLIVEENFFQKTNSKPTKGDYLFFHVN